MHVYTTTYMHVYTTTYMHVYTTTYMHVYTTTYMHVYTTTYMHVYTTTYMHALLVWICMTVLTEFQLGDTDQPLKLMYSWKTLLSRYGSGKGEAEIPSFHLWRNVFAPPLVEKTVSTNKQTNKQINKQINKQPSKLNLQVTDSIILEYLYTDVSMKSPSPFSHCQHFSFLRLIGTS